MSRRDLPVQLFQDSQHQQALNPRDQREMHLNDAEDGNWSDSPSEDNNISEDSAAATCGSKPLRNRRARVAPDFSESRFQPQVSADRPAHIKYNTKAGGLTIPYDGRAFAPRNNPFSPNLQPNAHSSGSHGLNPNLGPTNPGSVDMGIPFHPAGPHEGYPGYFQQQPYAYPPSPAPVTPFPYAGDPYATHAPPAHPYPYGGDPYAAHAHAHVPPTHPYSFSGDPYAAHAPPANPYPYSGDPYASHTPTLNTYPYSADPYDLRNEPRIAQYTPQVQIRPPQARSMNPSVPVRLHVEERAPDRVTINRKDTRRKEESRRPERQQAEVKRHVEERESDKVKANRKETRRKEESRKPERQQAEAVDRNKKEVGKTKQPHESKAKTEINVILQRDRGSKEKDPRVDSGTELPSTSDPPLFPALARKMDAAINYLDDKREIESHRVPDDITLFVDNQRQTSGRKPNATRSNISRSSSRKSDTESLYALKAGPVLKNKARDMLLVLDLLRSIEQEEEDEEEQNHLMLHPKAARDALIDFPDNTNYPRSRPNESQPRMSMKSLPNQRAMADNDFQNSPKFADHSSNRQEVRPSLRRQGEYSQQLSQVLHKDSEPLSPATVDSGYSSPPCDRTKVRFDSLGGDGQRRSNPSIGEDQRPERVINHSTRPKGRRGANQQAFQGIISSDESEVESSFARPRHPTRASAPYALSQGHPNLNDRCSLPTAPEVPGGP